MKNWKSNSFSKKTNLSDAVSLLLILKGKNYIAQNWNINKFTNNKYKDLKLNENPQPIIDQRDYKISPLSVCNNETASSRLVFFENELDFQFFNTNN